MLHTHYISWLNKTIIPFQASLFVNLLCQQRMDNIDLRITSKHLKMTSLVTVDTVLVNCKVRTISVTHVSARLTTSVRTSGVALIIFTVSGKPLPLNGRFPLLLPFQRCCCTATTVPKLFLGKWARNLNRLLSSFLTQLPLCHIPARINSHVSKTSVA
jgi:hypothetical protein